MTKEEIMAAIRECAEKVGQAPTLIELRKMMPVSKRSIRKHFGTYGKALKACGMERRGAGYGISLEELFAEWARVVRLLGRVPTVTDWEKHAQCSIQPLKSRFKIWKHVPQSLLEWARRKGLESGHEDVLRIMTSYVEQKRIPAWNYGTRSGPSPKTRVLMDQPIYGAPLFFTPMTFAPTNENGVLFLFGAMARELGFAVSRIQLECPDCEAWRMLDEEHWQRVRIEFEHESRNFLAHGHSLDDCDLIVCWKHNWPECPLEVLELSEAIGRKSP